MEGHTFCDYLQRMFPNQLDAEIQKTIVTTLTDPSRKGYSVFRGDTLGNAQFLPVFILIGINNNGLGHQYFYITEKFIDVWYDITHGGVPQLGNVIVATRGVTVWRSEDQIQAPKLDKFFVEYLIQNTSEYNKRLFSNIFRTHSTHGKI